MLRIVSLVATLAAMTLAIACGAAAPSGVGGGAQGEGGQFVPVVNPIDLDPPVDPAPDPADEAPEFPLGSGLGAGAVSDLPTVEPPEAFSWVRPPGSELHRAAYDGSVADVQTLLDLGAGVGDAIPVQLPNGEIVGDVTPLHLAAWNNTTEVANALLERGAELDARTDGEDFPSIPQWPLLLAVSNPNPGMLDLLLGWQPAPYTINWALIEAAKQDSIEAAQTLLAAGADVNFDQHRTPLAPLIRVRPYNPDYNTTPLMVAAKHNSVGVADLLLAEGGTASDRYTITPLHIAALNDSYETAQLLIARGAEVDTSIPYHQGDCNDSKSTTGGTPLHAAAAMGSTRTAELLLQNGADVSITARQDLYNFGMFLNDLTPLQTAVLRRADLATIELLLAHDSDLERPPASLLHLAILDGPIYLSTEEFDETLILPVVNLLLDRGADIEAPYTGRVGIFSNRLVTPLFTATELKLPETATLLLDRGANPKFENPSGYTPCEYARTQGTFEGTPLLGRLCKP